MRTRQSLFDLLTSQPYRDELIEFFRMTSRQSDLIEPLIRRNGIVFRRFTHPRNNRKTFYGEPRWLPESEPLSELIDYENR